MSALSHIGQFIGWTIIPPLLSQVLLKITYTLIPRFRPTYSNLSTQAEKEAADARARNHDINARIFLVGSYIIVNLVYCYISQSFLLLQNHYSLLGLTRSDVVVREDGGAYLKQVWRKLARTYHPDKIGKQGEAYFVSLRAAVEVLEDQNRRTAYDKFGYLVLLSAGPNASVRKYFTTGVSQIFTFYLTTVFVMVIISFFRKDERTNKYWRYLTMALAVSLELTIIMRPDSLPILDILLPNRIAYQHIAFIRQLWISTIMAFNQLGPLIFPLPPDPVGDSIEQANALARAETEILRPLLEQLIGVGNVIITEAAALQRNELVSLVTSHPEVVKIDGLVQGDSVERDRIEVLVAEELKEEMLNVFEDMALKNDIEGEQLWTSVSNRYKKSKDICTSWQAQDESRSTLLQIEAIPLSSPPHSPPPHSPPLSPITNRIISSPRDRIIAPLPKVLKSPVGSNLPLVKVESPLTSPSPLFSKPKLIFPPLPTSPSQQSNSSSPPLAVLPPPPNVSFSSLDDLN